MAITVASNSSSDRIQRELSRTTKALSSTYEKLSSGLRINRSADDAAGLALAESLKADTKIAAQAIRNANDGVSLVSIADGALEEIGNVLTRMAELSQQSANGTLTTAQRSSLAAEFVALGSEIHRISHTTEFNQLSLLSGSSDISVQVGFSAGSTSQIVIASVSGTLHSLGLNSGDTAQLTYSVNDASTAGAQAAATSALTAVRSAINTITTTRGTLGASENRLTSAISNLQSTRENLSAAESRIRDADIAIEAAQLVRLNILQQSGAAVLAQANQQPQLALELLS